MICFIFKTLKKAEQRFRKSRRSPEPNTSGSFDKGPTWDVKMVSPCRFTRINLEEVRRATISAETRELWGGIAGNSGYTNILNLGVAAEEERRRGFLKRYAIAVATLVILVLIASLLVHTTRIRLATLAIDVSNLTMRADTLKAGLTEYERDLSKLELENIALRQEQQAVRTGLERHERPKSKEKRITSRKKPTTLQQTRQQALEPASPWVPSLEHQGSVHLEVVKSPSVTAYSIR